MFRRGDVVWGKLRTCPWWPAMIINPKDCGRSSVGENKYWLIWLGVHQINEIEQSKVLDFKVSFDEKWRPKLGKPFNGSVVEALTILAARYKVVCIDPSSLLKWAQKGFPSKLRLRSIEPKVSELPNIITKALKKCCDPTEDIDDEIVKVLADVREGHKSLEDICVVCCKSKNKVIMKHPLHIGGACQKCKKSIFKIVKCPKGTMNMICLLCGEGGNLVYCCIPNCSSSYCKQCIDYMTPKGTYSKIVKNDEWPCFSCNPEYYVGSLIQGRKTGLSMTMGPPRKQKDKLPLRVLSLSDAALPVLKKKKISVGLYCIENTKCLRPSTSKQEMYNDFTREEIIEMQADFVYGSFFVPATDVVDKKKSLDNFFTYFYKFLFRLISAKEAKNETVPSVLFMFMADEIVDAEVKSRVKRFIPMDPIEVQLHGREMFIWTNIPDVKGIKDGKCTMKVGCADEETVLNKFLEPLKKFFKHQK